MATVSNAPYTNYALGINYRRKVTATTKDGGSFTILLPPQSAQLLERTEVKARTLREAEVLFKEAIDELAKCSTSERKVIVYRVKCETRVLDDGDREGGKRLPITFNPAPGIERDSTRVAVCMEAKTQVSDRTTLFYTRVESSLPFHHEGRQGFSGWNESDNVLDWTEEREAFFKHIIDSLHRLALKLAEVCRTPENILELVESGRLLPMAVVEADVVLLEDRSKMKERPEDGTIIAR